jgi:hypothetical protein
MELLFFFLEDEYFCLLSISLNNKMYIPKINITIDFKVYQLKSFIIVLHYVFLLNFQRQLKNHILLIYPYLLKYLPNSLFDTVIKVINSNFTFLVVDSYQI